MYESPGNHKQKPTADADLEHTTGERQREEGKGNHRPAREQWDSMSKCAPTNNYLNVQTEFSNQKTGNAWMGFKKSKTQLHVAYRRFTSALRTHIHSKWRDGKRYSKQGKTKRSGVTILKSDKTEAKNGKRQRGRSIHQEAITTINIYMPPTWEHC